MTATAGQGGPGLAFAMLGPLEVVRDGQRLALGGRQQRAVLAVLLTQADHALSAGRLADALWSEDARAGSVATVQTYVFHLREILEPDRPRGEPWTVLLTESGGYRLDVEACWVDARAFESGVEAGRAAAAGGDYETADQGLGRALALWRDDVLVDLADLPFVEPVAARLTALRLDAYELRAQCQLELGRPAAVVADLDRLVAEHPLREQLQAQRILALYRSGRQSEALAAYRDLRRVLDEELGVEPSPALRQLHQAVLAQDPALDWQAPPAAVATEEVAAPGAAPAAQDPQPVEAPAKPASRRSRVGRSLWRHRGITAVGAVGVVLALDAGIAVVADRSGRETAPTLAADSVGILDEHGGLGPSIPVGANPDAITYGDGAVWVVSSTEGIVRRVDPRTHAIVQRIRTGTTPAAVAVTNHDLWVANFGDGTVWRVSTLNYQVSPIHVGNGPIALAGGSNGVWVANYADNTIQRIDPSSGATDAPIPVGRGPAALAVDGDSVWVAASLDDTVTELDTNTKQLGDSFFSHAGPDDLVVTPTAIWVANGLSQSVTRRNRKTGLSATLPVGDGPHSIRVSRGAVWVSNEFDGTVARIDARDNSVQAFPVASSPRGLAVVNGDLWVVTGAFSDRRHRGGTLRIADASPPGLFTIDPAYANDFSTPSAEALVYDGLVKQRYAGGRAAQSLVPDLAEAIPIPAQGHLQYSFILRSGVRYSTGQLVQADDFRLGLRRALTAGPDGNPQLYSNVRGAAQCYLHPATCDVSAGIATNNARRQVTFFLSRPDPQFVYKLSEFVYPMPAGTPTGESKTPLPGTGPYMISAATPGQEFRLVRNKNFRQWSFAAQPDGYPDVIAWQGVKDDDEAVRRLEGGAVDLADLRAATRALLTKVHNAYPTRVHTDTLAQTSYVRLNVSRWPFHDLRARQAFNFAVDRDRVVELAGGVDAISPTCQILPPGFPSYRPDCPYTSGVRSAGSGRPDLAAAERLVTQSGTSGDTVDLVEGVQARDLAVGRYLASVLRSLHYRVTERRADWPDAKASAFISVRWGWVADYPQASNFYDNLFSCTQHDPLVGGHCDDSIAQLATSAHRSEQDDLKAANDTWTTVDRLLTEDARVVALGNLKRTTLVSARVGNYQSNAVTPLFSQMWVQ